MMNSYQPIPVEHNSGLFRVFEDYRKMREHKEGLEKLLKDTLQDWDKAEKHWGQAEACYNAEIRRLELLIARGTSGMTGLVLLLLCCEISRIRHPEWLCWENLATMQLYRTRYDCVGLSILSRLFVCIRLFFDNMSFMP
jgi:hypothetical protein